MMQPAGEFRIDAGHPSLAGHFPGRPVVPGVVLLDAILALIAPQRVGGLRQVKFLGPVLPGQIVTVATAPAKSGDLAFTGAVGGRDVLHGVIALDGA
jgi:3-hydroxymyristoyl/3-hydroxydecanoyl-(acyl carrier protein) dehydratase